jgi:hypothetical protein
MKTEEDVAFAACLLNSSFFYWLYSVFSDCEHVNDRFLRALPLPEGLATEKWGRHSRALSGDLSKHAVRTTIRTKQGHTIEYDEINASLSKDVINQIDAILGRHYDFTDEELDFIINYDIKYRMGQGSGGDEDE